MTEEYKLGDWGDSDGIGECEKIITDAGGVVHKGMIILPAKTALNGEAWLEACKAADYLCNEWDYSAKHADTW